MTKMTQSDEYDSPWKDILTDYFEQFLVFFFPDIALKIDWSYRRMGYPPAQCGFSGRCAERKNLIARELKDGKFMA